MASEARKLKRAGGKKEGSDGKAKKKAMSEPFVQQKTELPDPLGRSQLKGLGLRLGLPILGLWVVGLLIAGTVGTESAWGTLAIGLPGVVTVLAAGLVIWALRYARKAKSVQNILRDVDSAEDREEALKKLDSKKDVAATFAKAQLLMQQDPQKALAELEKIDLTKAMAPVADEARAQRAMIHLMQGEVGKARPLADGIDVSRHQDARTRAMMVAVVAEAWARTGQVKKALEKLGVLNIEDAEYQQIRPQLYRAQAFAAAYDNDVKTMRRALKKLLDQDVRLLGGFLVKKTHPMLQREVKKLIEQSGAVPRRVQMGRR